MVKKYEFLEKPGVGVIVLERARLPFRIFTRSFRKMFFRPDFKSAAIYELNLELIDLDKFMEVEDAFAAMSYLRSVDSGLTPSKLMIGLNTP